MGVKNLLGEIRGEVDRWREAMPLEGEGAPAKKRAGVRYCFQKGSREFTGDGSQGLELIPGMLPRMKRAVLPRWVELAQDQLWHMDQAPAPGPGGR